jgi:hypothetical protein
MWPKRRTTTTSRQVALREGFRSGFEQKAAAQLLAAGIDPAYETFKVPYTIPERAATYTADFRLPNGIIVETKGRFVTEDRKKHKLIKLQRPDLDIRIVFMRPNTTISKKSTTTYAKWCDDHGIKWAKQYRPDAPIPPEWFTE